MTDLRKERNLENPDQAPLLKKSEFPVVLFLFQSIFNPFLTIHAYCCLLSSLPMNFDSLYCKQDGS